MEKGFYGQPSIAAFADEKKYKTDEVKELYLTRVHVCCGSCERDLKAALKTVEGIEDHTDIEKGVGEFHLEGTFTEAQVMAALHAAGMHGSLSPNSRN